MQIGLLAAGIVRDGELIGDPTEGALVVLAAKGGIDAVSTRERYPRIAELPFDAAYKLMATFHTMKDASGREVIRCFVKGAPDQLLARAATAADTGPVPADGEFRQRYLAENQRLGQQGLRVIAIARKDFDPVAFDPGADLLPLVTGLELLALIGIVDPPRPTARASIAAAKKVGIRVRMITGDCGPAADRLAAGDAGQPVISIWSRTSMTPWAIHAVATTASCSAMVRTWPVSVMTPSLVSVFTSLPSGTIAERSSASWTCKSTSTGSMT
jgi:Ca2+-transporting ATPase